MQAVVAQNFMDKIEQVIGWCSLSNAAGTAQSVRRCDCHLPEWMLVLCL